METTSVGIGYTSPMQKMAESKRDPQVEALIKKARQAKIDAAVEDADQFIAEMMDNPLQPRVVSNEDVYLMESLKMKGLKIKPQWEDVTNEDGSTSKKKTGWSEVLIPER